MYGNLAITSYLMFEGIERPVYMANKIWRFFFLSTQIFLFFLVTTSLMKCRVGQPALVRIILIILFVKPKVDYLWLSRYFNFLYLEYILKKELKITVNPLGKGL